MKRAHAVGALLALLCGAPAAAHDRTVSYSSWEISAQTAAVTVRLSRLDASRLPWALDAAGADRRLGDYLARRLTLREGGRVCAIDEEPRRRPGPAERVVFQWRLHCAGDGALEIESTLLLDVAPTHLHFARVRLDGGTPLERVLSDGDTDWVLNRPDAAAAEPVGSSLSSYVLLGIDHMLAGYDHLAFLVALLLLAGTLRHAARIVAGFTVAHSVSLSAAVLGLLHPQRQPIEAVIGFSIAIVAAENLWLAGGRPRALAAVLPAALAVLGAAAARGYGGVPAPTLFGLALFSACYFGLAGKTPRADPLRATAAALFGLVHGLGFAGVLIGAKLPAQRLPTALLGFNLGVETGQLAALILLWALLALAARDHRIRRALLEYGSAGALALGVFWFVTRSFG
jgi:hypothetical protein